MIIRKALSAVSLAAMAVAAIPSASADEAPRRQALFGDLHIHTQYSFDAYIFGIRRTPDDAYRYARGETLRHAAGYDIRLKGGPLDFYAVSDHASYLGVLPAMDDASSPMSSISFAKDMFGTSQDSILKAFGKVFQSVISGEPIPEMDNRDVVRSAWKDIQGAADRYYQPGKFTTFAGYEYTAQPEYGNLHRVVLFKGMQRPDLPFGALDSVNPEGLWDWQDELRAKGIDSVAIPHNSNVSNGLMFQKTDFAGKAITAEYAEQRMRNEPIVEMSQVKGTSDTHPALSPNDEFADFELYQTLLGTNIKGKPDGSYIRQALQRGLEIEKKTGKNPYKFGLIGSSDSHNAGGPVEEDHYFGKTGLVDGTPEVRRAYVVPGEEKLQGSGQTPFYQWSAAGLAGVWAERNNREDIFAAFRRKETFATSGPRIKVRLFAGHGYPSDIFARKDFSSLAYGRGVPMGGDLSLGKRGAPTFLAQAIKDANSAGFERIQIIRGWAEGSKLKEAIYDIACASGKPDPKTHRCKARPASIDIKNCKIDPSDGKAEFNVSWRDPDYRAGRRAFYYLRVIERPTCRWSTWETNRLGKKLRKGIPATIQERGWSSPVWIKD